eukprot:2820001-Prymnesium_polylepis.1
MPPRPRACAHRPSMTFLGAGGSAVAAGGMSAAWGHGCTCAAQAVAVRCAPAAAPADALFVEPHRTSMFCTCRRRLR